MLINTEMGLLKENTKEMKKEKKKWTKFNTYWVEQKKCNCHIQVQSGLKVAVAELNASEKKLSL